ncbi:MAG: hypothetical protein Q9219_000914 [cf. Caloplaca sp. 3 TL-2023]
MSRSHSYSSHHSRGSRSYQAPSLAVTEASFQGLQISDAQLQPTYSTSSHYHSRGSYGQEGLGTTYLTPGYDTASFASSSPSGSYLGSHRGVSPFAALETEPSSFFEPEASAYPKTDMGSVLDAFSMEDREVARQRRRRLQESRRLAKARVRRSRLPTIAEPETSMGGLDVGHSIDFLAAPSTSSSYDIGGSSGYPRTASTSSAPYLSSVTG